MIKVLQVGFSDNYGGIEACIMNYYRNIDRSQIQFGFTDIRARDIAYKDEILSMGGIIHKLKSWSNNPLRGMKDLRKLIDDNGYDIVHFNMYSIANIFQFLAADQSKATAWLVHAHTTRGEIGRAKLFFQKINGRILAKKATCLCACSELASQWMFRNIPDKNNVTIINNAVDLNKLSLNLKKREELRNKYQIDDDTFVIGHIGRFVQPKNHTRLIDIFYQVHKTDGNTMLMLIGDGELRQSAEHKINDLGLNDAVIFTGMIPDACEYYNAFDLFLLPSLFEGLPVVGIEAQAAGLPVIVSDTVTREMQITKTVEYLPLSAGNEVWAEKILKYKNGHSRENNLSQLQTANMDIHIEADKLLKLYGSLIERRSHA